MSAARPPWAPKSPSPAAPGAPCRPPLRAEKRAAVQPETTPGDVSRPGLSDESLQDLTAELGRLGRALVKVTAVGEAAQLRSPQRAELTLSLFRDDVVAVPLDQVREFEPGTPLYTQQDVLWDLLEIELAGIIGLGESWGNEGDTG
jgi:hypothetical protein